MLLVIAPSLVHARRSMGASCIVRHNRTECDWHGTPRQPDSTCPLPGPLLVMSIYFFEHKDEQVRVARHNGHRSAASAAITHEMATTTSREGQNYECVRSFFHCRGSSTCLHIGILPNKASESHVAQCGERPQAFYSYSAVRYASSRDRCPARAPLRSERKHVMGMRAFRLPLSHKSYQLQPW